LIEKETNNKKYTSPKGNNTAVLISCIGIAFLLWFANKLTYEYDGYFKAKVNFINLPQDYVIASNTINEVSLHVRTKGFYLLLSKLNGNKINLEINASSLPLGKEFISSQYLKSIVAASLDKEYNLIGVQPDTLMYFFDKKFSKTLPVKFNYSLDFESQYGLASNIIIEPITVIISGPKKQIIGLKNLETETISLKNIKQDIFGDAKVISPDFINAALDPSYVKYTIKVEKYTEHEVDVPVRLINVSSNNNIILYPKKIKVTSLVSLNNFEKINPDMFELVADFSDINFSTDKYVPITLKRQPAFVKNINWSPKKVEYIINK
jgi:hypothetical protein